MSITFSTSNKPWVLALQKSLNVYHTLYWPHENITHSIIGVRAGWAINPVFFFNTFERVHFHDTFERVHFDDIFLAPLQEFSSMTLLKEFISMTLVKGFFPWHFWKGSFPWHFWKSVFPWHFWKGSEETENPVSCSWVTGEGATEGHRWGEKDMPFDFKEKNYFKQQIWFTRTN